MSHYEEEGSGFGCHAPIMVPDQSVSMCQLCSKMFTLTFRRHHCRACGRVCHFVGVCFFLLSVIMSSAYEPLKMAKEYVTLVPSKHKLNGILLFFAIHFYIHTFDLHKLKNYIHISSVTLCFTGNSYSIYTAT